MTSTVIWLGPLDGDSHPVELRAPDGLSGRMPATAVDDVRALDISTDGTPKAALEKAGLALYDALATALGPDFGPRLAAADDVVLDVEAAELRRLPWELLRVRPSKRMIFADETCPAVRARLPYAVTPAGVPTPVHVLLVVGDPTDSRINAQQEIDAVYAGVCELPACWQVDVLSGPSAPELKAAFADIKPHVLHFIGHGVDDEGVPALGVVSPVDGEWALTADFVVNALGQAQPPCLVVLNACRTAGDAEPAGEGLDAAWGVAEAFLDIDAGAVVTMQGDVASEAAVVFSKGLYRSLVRGRSLPGAVATARNDMAFDPRLRPRDWALPVLTARVDPANALNVVRHVEPDEAVRREPKVFDDVRWMVDRSAERRRLLRWLDGAGDDAAVGVVGVMGGERVGKSLIALACVLVGRMRGMPVAYVDLRRRGGHLDWVGFMTAVVEAAVTGAGPVAVVPAERFRTHLEKVAAEMTAGLPGRPAVSTITDSVMPPRRTGPLGPDDYYRVAFEGFDAFVDEVAGERPLLVVVDHVDQLQEQKPIVRWLIAPAAAAKSERIRIAVVGRENDLDLVLPGTVVDRTRDLHIAEFPPADIVRLAHEYCVRIQRRDDYRTAQRDEAVWKEFVDAILGWAEERSGGGVEVSPVDLKYMERANQWRVKAR
ncbi:CHAT domain-containing protein [Actinoplanes sp. NPDC048791]|uniref:CHAT domain-containing protein n=1 Tax=Actinoplanes sp. NPDC048791 TaxID=3154623 RepID=UPI0033C63533